MPYIAHLKDTWYNYKYLLVSYCQAYSFGVLERSHMYTFYQMRKRSFICSVTNNLTFPAHLHKQFEIVYVLSGSIQVTVNDITKDLSVGDLSISYPNTIHSLTTCESSRILLIIFDTHLVDNDFDNYFDFLPTNPFILSENLHKDVIYCLSSLIDMNKSELDYTLIKGYLTVILCHLIKQLDLVEVMHDHLNLVQQALVYIDNHYTEPITLDILAKDLKASKFYISRIFNNKLHTTFNSYINNKRIQFAKHLLITTKLSITDISFQSGFDSARTFYRAFNENCGYTPREYRNNNQNYPNTGIHS